jgi:hypothetical protein
MCKTGFHTRKKQEIKSQCLDVMFLEVRRSYDGVCVCVCVVCVCGVCVCVVCVCVVRVCVCVWNTWLINSNHKTGRIYVVCSTGTLRGWIIRWYYYKSLFYPEEVVSTRTALFWAITQQIVVTPYRRFGQPIGPETSLRNDHYLLRNSPEDRGSHTAYPSHLEVFKMGLIGCPEMSVRI